MDAKLSSYVHVTDDVGRVHVFGPDDEVPEWAAAKITNPRAWETAPEGHTGRRVDTVTADLGHQPPPRSGAGSGRDAWLKHAVAIGVLTADSTASRDDIIAAVESNESSRTETPQTRNSVSGDSDSDSDGGE